MKIGVLALQGGFSKHLEMLDKINTAGCEIRYPHQLESCSSLIIPGGESTVMYSLIEKNGLLEPLRAFSRPIFGTCAGLILMGKVNLLGIAYERNAYGRQSASFSTSLTSSLGPVMAVFIRAPKITKILSPEIEILSTCNQDPVLIKQGNRLGCTFHPELSGDCLIHRYFTTLA